MTISESKCRFSENESIRLTNRIDSNRELECSTTDFDVMAKVFSFHGINRQTGTLTHRCKGPTHASVYSQHV